MDWDSPSSSFRNTSIMPTSWSRNLNGKKSGISSLFFSLYLLERSPTALLSRFVVVPIATPIVMAEICWPSILQAVWSTIWPSRMLPLSLSRSLGPVPSSVLWTRSTIRLPSTPRTTSHQRRWSQEPTRSFLPPLRMEPLPPARTWLLLLPRSLLIR